MVKNKIQMTPRNVNFGCSACNKNSGLDFDLDDSKFIITEPKQNNKVETIFVKKTQKSKSVSNSSKITSLF